MMEELTKTAPPVAFKIKGDDKEVKCPECDSRWDTDKNRCIANCQSTESF